MERFADERVCILQGPTWASISGIRVAADEVGSLLAEVRGRVAREKEPMWWIGPSATPPDLLEQLTALGVQAPSDRSVILHALALTEEPERPAGVDVALIETFDQYQAARTLAWDAFELPERRRVKERPRLRENFEEARRIGIPVSFIATLDGRPAGTASLVPSDRGVFLVGGSTAKWARGRGVYRALVAERWEFAVARGTPALVTHAKPDTSHPILRRLGFEEVCTIRRLEDRRLVQASGERAEHAR